jgi:hypothetical protein
MLNSAFRESSSDLPVSVFCLIFIKNGIGHFKTGIDIQGISKKRILGGFFSLPYFVVCNGYLGSTE